MKSEDSGAKGASAVQQRMLLWNSVSVVAFAGAALACSIAVYLLLASEREGVIDPEATPIFLRLFLFEDYPAAFLSLLVVLAALMPPLQNCAFALFRRVGERPREFALAVTLFLGVGALAIYRAHPLSMDEYAAYFQSQAFASGRLFGRFPTELLDWLIYPEFRGFFLRVSAESGEIGSGYWPGFALLLTPFTKLGLPWLCNPVMGGIAVFVLYRLASELGGDSEVCGATALFAVASPAFVINAVSFYSMTAHLVCNAIFALLLLSPLPKRCLAAGFVGGFALILHNPMPHMLFAIPWIAWLLLRRDRLRTIPMLIAGYLPAVIVGGFGWYWALGTLAPGVSEGAGTGAGGAIGAAISGLSSVIAVPSPYILHVRLLALAKLWLWAVPGLPLLAAVGCWRHRRDHRYQLLIASAVMTFVGFLFVPVDQGHGWGFRYFHSAWFVLPLLAAAALIRPVSSGSGVSEERFGFIARYVGGAALMSLLVLIPYYGWQVRTFIDRHLAQLPAAQHGVPRLVIVNPGGGYYAQDLVQNDAFLRGPVITMVTNGRGADEDMIARRFPDLVLLGRTFRGSVWGSEAEKPLTESGRTGSVTADEPKQE